MTKSFTVSPNDETIWRGAVEWVEEADLWQPWLLRSERIATAHSRELAGKARMTPGVRAEVGSDARSLSLEIRAKGDDIRPLDLLVDGELFARREVLVGRTRFEADLPAGQKTIEVWLPQFGELAVGSL